MSPTTQPQFTHYPPPKTTRLKVRTDDDGTRFYQSPNGDWYPSASTVANWDKKEFFENWRKNPKNFAEGERAKKRGNMLHESIERYLNNRDDYLNPLGGNIHYNFLFDQIRSDLAKISNIRAQETALYSDVMQLAGRVDLVADYDGVLSIVDFKGSSRTKKEEWIESYLVQATMYAIMYHERYGTPIKQIVIIITCEDGNSQVFKRDPMDYVKRTKECIDLFRSDNKAVLKKLNS